MGPLGIAITSIIVIIIAAYLVITKILPMVKDLLEGVISGGSLGAFMSLLIIVIYIIVFDKVIKILVGIEGNKYLAYLSYLIPGIEVLTDTLPYVKYILLGALIAWGMKNK